MGFFGNKDKPIEYKFEKDWYCQNCGGQGIYIIPSDYFIIPKFPEGMPENLISAKHAMDATNYCHSCNHFIVTSPKNSTSPLHIICTKKWDIIWKGGIPEYDELEKRTNVLIECIHGEHGNDIKHLKLDTINKEV